MSRVGINPIPVPSGVDVNIGGSHVTVKGSKGTLEIDLPGDLTLNEEEGNLVVARPDETRESRSLHGLTRTLIANMITGVSEGYRKELTIVGVGYRANLKGPQKMELQLGYSHPIEVNAPDGISFEVPIPTQIFIDGIDKQLVGQVAANIRELRKPEPYKGKGVRYVDEHVVRKAGKAAK